MLVLVMLVMLVLMLVLAVYWTVRNAARPAVTNPGEILLLGNGPGFEVLRVLRNTGERHVGRSVVLTGLVAELPSTPERSFPTTRPESCGAVHDDRERGSTGVGSAGVGSAVVRGGHVFGDGSHLLLGDVRVVVDGERDREIGFVKLIPEARQAAHSADTRPGHY